MTYKDLLSVLSKLSDKSLNKKIMISEGCDDNGNAIFYNVNSTTFPGDGIIDSALDDTKQLVLLYVSDE